MSRNEILLPKIVLTVSSAQRLDEIGEARG